MSVENSLGPASDAVYALLLAAHEGLSEAQSRRLEARLVLALAAQLTPEQVRAAVEAARKDV